MITWLLQSIPIVGKVVDGISSYFNKKLDTDLEKYKVDGKIDEVSLQAAMTVWGNMQDRSDRGMRWIFAYPLGLWWILALTNSGLKDVMGWKWQVHSFPLLEQWGWAIVAFLFLVSMRKRA